MHLLKCHKCNTAVTIFFVIQGGEILTEYFPIVNGTESLKKLRTVLRRSELGLRIGGITANVREIVGLSYPEIRQ